jgi:hypothetical protein
MLNHARAFLSPKTFSGWLLLGVNGAGEDGIVATGAGIANAVADALAPWAGTSQRCRSAPHASASSSRAHVPSRADIWDQGPVVVRSSGGPRFRCRPLLRRASSWCRRKLDDWSAHGSPLPWWPWPCSQRAPPTTQRGRVTTETMSIRAERGYSWGAGVYARQAAPARQLASSPEIRIVNGGAYGTPGIDVAWVSPR